MKNADPDRVKQLFSAALECPPHELPAFLCSVGEDDLRSEVESLLRSFEIDGDFLESSVFSLSAANIASGVLQAEPERSMAGHRIGPYRLIREIGRGGMGAVYLAVRDDGQYEQQVALKIIKLGMDSEDVVRRFRRERQILARLNHENISRLLDGGMTADGRPYFVMEYVDGLSIDKYVETHHLSIEARLKIFRAVCGAVQYAHDRKVIHRDIKPSNVLITPVGTAKLLDFGIAKFLDSDSSTKSIDQTDTALRALTPEYASPEQLDGLPLTEASDIYSLGVVLYKLLTGRSPYSVQSRKPQEILKLALGTNPDKPSFALEKRVFTFGGRLSKNVSQTNERQALKQALNCDLDNIVLMALRREPQRRYASVEQFSSDIALYLKGMPVLARKDTLTYRSVRFLKRHRASALSSLALALLCLCLGVLLSPLFRSPPSTRKSIAVLPLISVNTNPELEHLADGITDALIESLSSVPNVAVPRQESVFRFKGQTDSQVTGRLLNVETVLKGTVTSDGQELSVNMALIDTESAQVIWSKKYDGVLWSALPLQNQIADDVSRKLGWELSDEARTQMRKRNTQDGEAYRLYLMGRYFWNKRTAPSFREGMEYFRGATQKDPNYSLAYSGLADCYALLGAYQVMLPPDAAFLPAKAAALKAIELDDGLAEGHTSLALILWLYDWDWTRAEEEFRRSIELNPRYVTAHHWYGLFLGEMGRFDEAIVQMQQALAYDPISAPVLADFGRVYFWARRYGAAFEKYHKAKEVRPEFDAYMVEATELYDQVANDERYSEYKALGWSMGVDRNAYLTGGSPAHLRKQLRPLTGGGFTRAEVYARLGESDKAFADLDEAFRTRDHRITQIKVNPKLDSLRRDPRFAELLRRMNLSP
jgi:serine/threonine protein kinase/tetratricopeptide (TPR) repeat protein